MNGGGTIIHHFCFNRDYEPLCARNDAVAPVVTGGLSVDDGIIRVGEFGLSLEDDDKDRRRKSPSNTDAAGQGNIRPSRKKAPAPEVGQALRSVYQRTIDETIPPEMLDLLGKLG